MENINLVTIIIGIIIVLIIVIIILFKKRNNVKVTRLDNIAPEQTKEIIKEYNLPSDILDQHNNASTFTTIKTVRKVKYINGQKVSDETETLNQKINPLTNCPNCGAKIDNTSNGTCHYCNTTFTNYQITK